MLPGSLHFELPENAMDDDDVQSQGGFADVLKREYGGREVAVKVLRLRRLGLEKIRKVNNLDRLLSVRVSAN